MVRGGAVPSQLQSGLYFSFIIASGVHRTSERDDPALKLGKFSREQIETGHLKTQVLDQDQARSCPAMSGVSTAGSHCRH